MRGVRKPSERRSKRKTVASTEAVGRSIHRTIHGATHGARSHSCWGDRSIESLPAVAQTRSQGTGWYGGDTPARRRGSSRCGPVSSGSLRLVGSPRTSPAGFRVGKFHRCLIPNSRTLGLGNRSLCGKSQVSRNCPPSFGSPHPRSAAGIVFAPPTSRRRSPGNGGASATNLG